MSIWTLVICRAPLIKVFIAGCHEISYESITALISRCTSLAEIKISMYYIYNGFVGAVGNFIKAESPSSLKIICL
jgi:hypothetical protein